MEGATGQLGVGIVGWGSIARTHAEAVSTCPDARLVAVYRRTGTRPADLPAGVEAVTDMSAFLARVDVDIVAVCTPTGAHGAQALGALEAGKHVVVEKPLARWHDEARAVVDAARAHGRLLSTISQRRFEPAVQAIAGSITRGGLGRPVLGEALLRWHRSPQYYAEAAWRGTIAEDGGVLLNQGIHLVDLLRWLMGPVRRVEASLATLVHDIEAEDTAVASLAFESGALGLISATTATRPGLPGELNLFFERGCVGLSEAGVTRWEVPDLEMPASVDTGRTDTGSGAADPGGIGSTGHQRQWRDILDAVRTGRQPAVDGEAGLAALDLILAIQEASRTTGGARPRS